ncbi:MAG: DJ-1/PfpI family protein [Nanoarchaeota archaeon]|nr:DJ-1/PfpI family protein [Nanoarchaeota archaeon]
MNVILPLADGFEEIEAVTVIDVLRRANVHVDTVGIQGTLITSSRGIQMKADKKMDDVNTDKYDALVLVGGSPGYLNLGKSKRLMDTITKFNEEKKTLAAICAAPSLLAKAGILDERRATIFPGMEREIPRPRDGKVIIDEHVITSQGPGTAMEFALSLVERFKGRGEAETLRKKLVA